MTILTVTGVKTFYFLGPSPLRYWPKPPCASGALMLLVPYELPPLPYRFPLKKPLAPPSVNILGFLL